MLPSRCRVAQAEACALNRGPAAPLPAAAAQSRCRAQGESPKALWLTTHAQGAARAHVIKHTPCPPPEDIDFEAFAKAFSRPSQLAAADGEDGGNCLGWAARDASAKLAPYRFRRRELGPKDVFVKITHAGALKARGRAGRVMAEGAWRGARGGGLSSLLQPGRQPVRMQYPGRKPAGQCVGFAVQQLARRPACLEDAKTFVWRTCAPQQPRSASQGHMTHPS